MMKTKKPKSQSLLDPEIVLFCVPMACFMLFVFAIIATQDHYARRPIPPRPEPSVDLLKWVNPYFMRPDYAPSQVQTPLDIDKTISIRLIDQTLQLFNPYFARFNVLRRPYTDYRPRTSVSTRIKSIDNAAETMRATYIFQLFPELRRLDETIVPLRGYMTIEVQVTIQLLFIVHDSKGDIHLDADMIFTVLGDSVVSARMRCAKAGMGPKRPSTGPSTLFDVRWWDFRLLTSILESDTKNLEFTIRSMKPAFDFGEDVAKFIRPAAEYYVTEAMPSIMANLSRSIHVPNWNRGSVLFCFIWLTLCSLLTFKNKTSCIEGWPTGKITAQDVQGQNVWFYPKYGYSNTLQLNPDACDRNKLLKCYNVLREIIHAPEQYVQPYCERECLSVQDDRPPEDCAALCLRSNCDTFDYQRTIQGQSTTYILPEPSRCFIYPVSKVNSRTEPVPDRQFLITYQPAVQNLQLNVPGYGNLLRYLDTANVHFASVPVKRRVELIDVVLQCHPPPCAALDTKDENRIATVRMYNQSLEADGTMYMPSAMHFVWF